MRQPSGLLDLVEKHHLLEDEIKHERGQFVSDWNGTHPFVSKFLGPQIVASGLVSPQDAGYIYFDEQKEILELICRLHRQREGLNLSPDNVLAGPGSSSLLLALVLWTVQQGYTEAFYVPPLYYTVHYFMRMLGVRLRPVSGRHVFEEGASLNLPNRKTLLLLCDPVWFAGRRVPLEKMAQIVEWQRATDSLVMVDGSFQFMQWADTREEHSSRLDPELTFRIIAPTKALAIPFFRFAYMLHPSWAHRDLLFTYENTVGSSTVADLAFARRSLDVLMSESSNYPLTHLLAHTFEELTSVGLLRTRIQPDCGYFTFAVPSARIPQKVVMDQEFFELEGYPDHVRINLMRARELYLNDDVQRPTEP